MKLIEWKFSKSLQWLIRIFVLYLVIFTTFRVITLFLFKPVEMPYAESINAFLLGVQYDLRWISFIFLPPVIFNLIPQLSPFYSELNKKIWTIYFALLTLIVLFLFGADFGQFAYVRARLNADALNFFEDPKEMWEMVSTSYPIFWILLALGMAVFGFFRIFKKMHGIVEGKNEHLHKFYHSKIWNIILLLLIVWFIRGAFTFNVLRFDRAFKMKNNFVANLALNPMQNFFTTLRFRKPDTHNEAGKYYKEMVTFLGIDLKAKSKISPYERLHYPTSKATESRPNVVVVICESFSMYKSSMSGNPLNSTPYFDQLTKEGLFFNRCFSPHFSTARGIYATITGIPDVQMGKFSSRNEDAVQQRTIINDFKDYNKTYFIGGSAEFNNFRGLIENIKDVKLYEEGSYKSPKANVWGISDNDLFKEANDVFKVQKAPFISVIQTADNHRPFDLYKKDSNFKPRNISSEELEKYGFDGIDEFNTFCFSDYCFKNFIESAKKEAYFNNTIFIFFGDHGVEGNCNAVYPKSWSEQRLSEEHIPLLFYAPNLIKPEIRNEIVSQIDVLPTAASLAGIPYSNTSLGRDLTIKNTDDCAFIIYHAPGWIGVVNDSVFYRYNIRSKVDELVSIKNNRILENSKGNLVLKEKLKRKTFSIYETSKWMLLNN
jgi:phosphoglycerol transferase MdoB-like AlkP superfamily enzyme